MKIAIFTDYYLPSLGGTQTAIAQQKKALEASGHEVVVVTVNYLEWRRHKGFILLPSPVRVKQGTTTIRGFVPVPSIEQVVIAKLRKWGVDVIHVETEFSVGALGCRVAKKLRVPCVYTAHTLIWLQSEMTSVEQLGILSVLTQLGMMVYLPGRRRRVARLPGESRVHYVFRKLVINYADYATIIASPSQHLKDKLVGWGVETPIVLQPNFCDIDPKRQPLPQKPVFLWAGRLDPEKRPLDFVAALEELDRRCEHDSFEAMIVGDGELLGEVKRRIGHKPWLTHIGPVPYDQMSDIIDQCSVSILTSQNFDNQPMIIAESVLHGRGVVLVDRCLTEGLDGGAGLWAEADQPDALADTLESIVREPKIAQLMSDAAWNNRTIFMADHGVKGLESIYERAIRLHEHAEQHRKRVRARAL